MGHAALSSNTERNLFCNISHDVFLLLSHRICKNFFGNSFGLPIPTPIVLGNLRPDTNSISIPVEQHRWRMASAEKVVVALDLSEPAIAAGLARRIHDCSLMVDFAEYRLKGFQNYLPSA